MLSALVKQENPEESDEVAESYEAQAESANGKHLTELAQVTKARLENMSLVELEHFVASAEKSKGHPYRDKLAIDELKTQLSELRTQATMIMQAVIEEEQRRNSQAWYNRAIHVLNNRGLLIPLGAAVMMTIFLSVWYLKTGNEPVIAMNKENVIHLPIAMTRWLDVPCIFLVTMALTKTMRLIKKLSASEYDLIALGAGLFIGFVYGVGPITVSMLFLALFVGLFAGFHSGLTTGLFSGPRDGLRDGLRAVLISVPANILGYGLGTGLIIGLAPALPVWLPPALILWGLARYMLKKQRGW